MGQRCANKAIHGCLDSGDTHNPNVLNGDFNLQEQLDEMKLGVRCETIIVTNGSH